MAAKSQIPCGSKNFFVKMALSCPGSEIITFLCLTQNSSNAEIQEGRQKWRENEFCEMSPIDSGDILRVKNFIEIALSRSVSYINGFLRLTQKFKMAPKSGRKTIFLKIASRLWRYPVGQKFRQNCSISLRFQDKQVFVFNAEIQDGCQKWQEKYFWEKLAVDCADTLCVKNFIKIALSGSISEISGFLRLTQKFKVVAKSGGKMIFAKSCQ